ncbi:hypothetical protein [Neobacillus sp. OS1-33]|uniref:hypothetical protein n=1 Tax=Neobacillus sp. OS1-33 TaxID=3070683 RepID=UPI0027E0D743|nr:hypothetical protein [Neobacillus sp. OS1-33]WML26290.1 hypothetical protein RCG22_01190 [Neobacillus sp. OS1-33]
MDKRWEHHKGVNKQYLMKSQIKPPDDEKRRAEDMIQDEEVINIFVDASELKYQGIFGLGVCFVGQGEVIVKSKKHYNQLMKKQIIYAELLAIIFALEQITTIHKQGLKILPDIRIFSDLALIEKLNSTSDLTKNQSINLIADRIRNLWETFAEYQPEKKLQIQSMSHRDKRHNPFYKAAHNAARKIIGL